MTPSVNVEKCLSFINCQLQPPGPAGAGAGEAMQWKAVTISRQTGAGGHTVAEKLAEILQARSFPSRAPWTVFDRNLVEKVLEEHHLPSRMAQFMTEDRMSEISDTLDELFGLHPPSWTLVRNSADTILRLTELGNVVLIGRGASVITAKLRGVFHVRLVGSLERRIEYVCQQGEISPRRAREMILEQDRGRRRYLQKYFGRDIDDPMLYHLVINTDVVAHMEAAQAIANAMFLIKVKGSAPEPEPEREVVDA